MTQPIAVLAGLVSLASVLAGQTPLDWVDITDLMGIESGHRLPPSGHYYLTETFTGRSIPFDFDMDGDLDLLLTYGPHVADSLHQGLNRLFRNDDTLWVDITDSTGLALMPPASNAAVGDINGDGYPDLYLCLFGADRLLINQAGKRWLDVTDSVGISNSNWAVDALFLDANNDGLLDIYIANYLDYSSQDTLQCFDPATNERIPCDPELYDPAPNILYINDGTGNFRDATMTMGLADTTSRSRAILPLDVNGDGVLDIFVLSHRSPNLLYLGGIDSAFVEVGIQSGVALAQDGTEPAWNQVTALHANGDSSIDLLLTTRSGAITLLLNDGKGGFYDGRYPTGLFRPLEPYRATIAATLDLDFDGDDDLLVAHAQLGWAADSLMTDSTDHAPPQFLVHGNLHRFESVSMTRAMTLDTTLLIPIVLDPTETESTLNFPTVEATGEGLFPVFPQILPFALTEPDLPEPLPPESPDTSVTFDSTRVDTVALDSTAIPVELIAMDTVQIHEEPNQFVIADLTGNGIQEIIATYPSGLVRVWNQTLDNGPQFVGIQLTAEWGRQVIGARITISAGEVSRQYRLMDQGPVLFYVPEEAREVSVEIRWPDSSINRYFITQLNRYYTLTPQEPD